MRRNFLRLLSTGFAAVCLLSAAAFAGDPTGTWSWTMPGRDGGPGRTATITLVYKDGALTGSLSGRRGATPISDASFKGDAVAFSVTREFRGNSFTLKFSGKLEGDTITGTIQRPDPDGGDPITTDWKATRQTTP